MVSVFTDENQMFVYSFCMRQFDGNIVLMAVSCLMLTSVLIVDGAHLLLVVFSVKALF
jgi:hypothetical protein